MEISKQRQDSELTVALKGRLDTITSAELLSALEGEEYDSIVFDFAELEYISSSGLRVLFSCRKKVGEKNKIKVIHANALIQEIFRVTGFGAQIEID